MIPKEPSPTFVVVLVAPQESMNVGAVARVMKNFGVEVLRLVAPRNYDQRRAAITACHASDVLDTAEVHEHLAAAVADCVDVVGFSGKDEGCAPPRSDLGEWLEEMRSQQLPQRRVALVFGPEDTGLTREHTPLCRLLVRIPSSDSYASLNLSHAVAIVLFSLKGYLVRRGDLNDGPEGALGVPLTDVRAPDPATSNDYAQLDRLVREVAEASGFFRAGTPEPVPRIMQSLVRRLQLSKREAAILLGFFGRLHRTLRRYRSGGYS